MFRSLTVVILTMGVAHASMGAPTDGADVPSYHLGRPATAADIAAAGISVGPDGIGLPRGQATAGEGRPLYASLCAACHGLRGEGNDTYPALVGGRNTLKSPKPILTIGSYWPYATTVWDYINRAMPYSNPGTLRSQQVYALTAYLLYLNKIVSERQLIDQDTLPRIRMPNRHGFVADPRPDVHEK
jgi:cytochrome c